MGALERIACLQDRRDEVPNQQLARELAMAKDVDGICEIAENLSNKDKNIQADCIKVLYEIGYLHPTLIAQYAEEFIKLLHSHNNRLAWGGMIALATIADLRPQVILAHLEEIEHAMECGSIIAADNGVQVLARAASKDEKGARQIVPYLQEHLRTCPAKSVPQHAEKCLPAINGKNKSRFILILNNRLEDLSGAALARVRKVIKLAEAK